MSKHINQRRLDDAVKALKQTVRSLQITSTTDAELNQALLFTLGNRLGDVCPHCVRGMAFDLMDMADTLVYEHPAGNA
jgi:hypothetical protein